MSFESFYKITLNDMREYIETHANDDKTKAEFKKALYPMTKATVLRPVYDDAGNPKMKYSEAKKAWYPAQERIVLDDSPLEAKFNLAAGKLWFIERFKDDEKIGKLTPKKEKKKADKPNKTDFLKDW